MTPVGFNVSPTALSHLLAALRQEVADYDEAYRRLKDDEDKPDDYDPNDRAHYIGMIAMLEPHVAVGYRFEDPLSRPIRLTFGLIPYYVRQNRAAISDADLQHVFRAYAAYVSGLSLACIEVQLTHGNTSHLLWMKAALKKLLEFPD